MKHLGLNGDNMNFDFYRGKTVLITGHTGFKGSWLTRILINLGANVVGYSLEPDEDHQLFEMAQIKDKIHHVIGDILDYDLLYKTFKKYKPEIVFHLAAQPIVIESYNNPRNTYNINVMGTVNVLDCIKNTSCVKTFVNITTDKVYKNPENGNAFLESDVLNGYDPYSNSKSCSELVTECYYNSFLKEKNITVVTMRAGNVIGGGDFAKNRIIPDCVRAALNNEPIIIRNPNAVRPFQHVLEPLFAYLLVGSKTFNDIQHYNVGPQRRNHVTIEKLVNIFCKSWPNTKYIIKCDSNAVHEARLLYLNCNKIHKELGWKPIWNINTTVKKVCDFYRANNIPEIMDEQINEYKKGFEELFK